MPCRSHGKVTVTVRVTVTVTVRVTVKVTVQGLGCPASDRLITTRDGVKAQSLGLAAMAIAVEALGWYCKGGDAG